MQALSMYVISITYADDTSTSISHKLLSEVKRMLENIQDLHQPLSYMMLQNSGI